MKSLAGFLSDERKEFQHHNDTSVATSKIVRHFGASLILLSPVISTSLSVRVKFHIWEMSANF